MCVNVALFTGVIASFWCLSSAAVARICEGQSSTISCNGQISVSYANYGRLSNSYCPSGHNTNCRAGSSYGVVTGACNGRSSCHLSSLNSVFGDPCVGTYKYLEVHYSCNTRRDGNWGGWGSWSGCTRSCGSGSKTRYRSCNNPSPAYGGSSCSGSSSHSTSCNTQSCPIHGGWSGWGSWGGCTRSCGSGTKTRTRGCTNPTPQYGGNQCSGSSSSSTSCNTHACPIHGGWGSWGSWGSCSKTCATGSKSRTRSCNNPSPQHGGNQCPGSGSSSTTCNTHHCPIHGGWSDWGSWGGCSRSCGSGTKTRTRGCTNPTPQYGGNQCSGSSSSSTSCNTHACPIHGGWGSWGSWGSCSKSCATGSKSRTRPCNNPTPQHGGNQCPGSGSSSTTCNTHHCPIDGGWTSWASWTSCSLTCKDYGTSQTGTRSRTRACTNPSPQYNGQDCPNFDFEVQVCTTATYCPIHGGWTSWVAWSSCSVTCASGTKTRSRTCTNPSPQFLGNQCSGSVNDQAVCTLTPCPIDGAWTSWANWGTCTKTCGGGTSQRARTCTNPTPQYNGANCPSVGSETKDCNTQICIIDGDWGAWQAWGTCTLTCATGTKSRRRICDNPAPANGGQQCPGVSSEFEDCNTQACPAPQAGVYQQKCPGGWFSCESGIITCIDQAFACDCNNDCDDGSDETSGYAQCAPDLVASCSSGARVKVALLFAVVTSLWSLSSAAVVRVCEGHSSSISCNGQISVSYANYGRLTNAYCSSGHNTNCRAGSSLGVVTNTCNGRSSCTLRSLNSVFGDPCVGTYKYLEVHYTCQVRRNGNWGGWGGWGGCSKNCGSGSRSRSRSCNNPSPAYGGSNCAGSSSQSGSCNTHSCPIHGAWGGWGGWASCTKSCGSGTKTRTRRCDSPAPQHGGNQCPGSSSNSASCNTHSCPVHGAWGGWGAWGSCSKSCGSGTKTRTRGCDSPAPQHGGNQCPGSSSNAASCNTQSCPSWIPIFKVAHRQSLAPASGVHNLWTGTYTVNPYDETAMSYKAGTKTFKSSVVDNWSRHNIERVRVSFYSGEREKFHIVFNAAGTDKNNWFACNRILYTSYNDLNTGSTNNFCSINGDSGLRRYFYLNKQYGGCNGDVGWMTVVEGTACGWEQKTTRPYFLYSDASGSELSNNMAVAEVFVISVNMDICNPNPCQNGAQCSDRGARYQCSCPGSWKGMACQDRDGAWGSWGSWASCSKTCGGGSKIKRRSCSGKVGAGNDCSGSSSTTTSCNTHNCPIHGQWGSWAAWGSCSKTCASGTKTRKRACNNPAPQYNGNNCAGSSSSSTSCNTHHCPIHGQWGAWAAWGSCSKTCAGGTKNRKRACNNPAPQYNGNNCAGSSSSSTSCNTHHCPIHGAWSNWAAWGACTVTCGGGTQDRGRTCSNPTPQYGGQDCAGAKSSRQDCNTHHCPIDGGWTSWNSWTSCSLTCKDYGTSQTGTKSRQRSCTNPAPQYQGKDCPNFDFELAVCTTSTYCAIHGGFTQWTAWTACSVTCATGSKTRERTCTDPSPRFGGNNCAGALDDTATCTLSPCPIDGKWTAWAPWSTCTKTCGTGESHRTRTCTNPAPQYNGAACGGAPSEQKLCNTQVCIIDGDWGTWTPWGGCTASCGNGTQSKTRVCDSPRPKNGGLPCPGSSSEFQNCNPNACPAPLAGVYTQKCPSGWFSCESGAMTCIQQAFVCDCGRDCDDGSDEDTSYANCSPELVETCGSGAEGVKIPVVSVLLCFVVAQFLLCVL